MTTEIETPVYDDEELQRRYRALDKIMTALAAQYRRDGDPFSTENLELFAENLAFRSSVGPANLARAIAVSGAMKTGDFTLSSGRKSTYYLDLRVLNTTTHVSTSAGTLLALAGRFGPYDALVGPAVGAVPMIGACLALSPRPLRGGWVLKEPKGHGTGATIEGSVLPGDRVVVLEDVVTTGGSVVRTVKALIHYGCEVVGVACLVDRTDEAAATLAVLHIPFAAALTPTALGIKEAAE
jgi:orotate phosphoribosyltransferase